MHFCYAKKVLEIIINGHKQAKSSNFCISRTNFVPTISRNRVLWEGGNWSKNYMCNTVGFMLTRFPSVKDIVDSKTKSFLVKIIHLFIECAFDGYRIYSLQSSLSTVNLKQKFHLLIQKTISTTISYTCMTIIFFTQISFIRDWDSVMTPFCHSGKIQNMVPTIVPSQWNRCNNYVVQKDGMKQRYGPKNQLRKYLNRRRSCWKWFYMRI